MHQYANATWLLIAGLVLTGVPGGFALFFAWRGEYLGRLRARYASHKLMIVVWIGLAMVLAAFAIWSNGNAEVALGIACGLALLMAARAVRQVIRTRRVVRLHEHGLS